MHRCTGQAHPETQLVTLCMAIQPGQEKCFWTCDANSWGALMQPFPNRSVEEDTMPPWDSAAGTAAGLTAATMHASKSLPFHWRLVGRAELMRPHAPRGPASAAQTLNALMHWASTPRDTAGDPARGYPAWSRECLRTCDANASARGALMQPF